MTLPFSAILPPEAPLPPGRSGLVIDVQPPYHQGRVTLHSELFLDAIQVPVAPGRWLVAIAPGHHALRMTTTQGRGLQTTLTLAEGETCYAGPYPWDGTGPHLLPAPPPLPHLDLRLPADSSALLKKSFTIAVIGIGVTLLLVVAAVLLLHTS